MCGIIGYCGRRAAGPVIFQGLKSLEYRGYDSAGIASICDGGLVVRKGTGTVDHVNLTQGIDSMGGCTAIGHTRWATHGGVTDDNAHPHTDCTGTIAVTHNGIVENYRELRDELKDKGHRFTSDTDTEVIPHLIEEELATGERLEEAVRRVVQKLRGSYAFAAVWLNEPEKVVGARKDNPLIVGVQGDESFISSDALAFSMHTRHVIVPGDCQVVCLGPESVEVIDAQGKRVPAQMKELDGSWADNHKGVYPFFMLKEIMEQSEILERTAEQDAREFTELALDILRANQVIITACGTSRYAALVGRYLFSKVGRKFSDVVMASEFGYFADSVDRNTLVIAVSQSGETADVIEGVKAAREAGAEIVSIVNRPNSLLGSLSHRVVNLNCGAEIGVAATKSFLSQLAAFYLLAFSMVNSFDEAKQRLCEMCGKVADVLDGNNEGLVTLSRQLRDKNDFYYIARGINFAIASEGALKLKEISYIHAEGMPAGELKHGTLALISRGTPVVVICPADYTFEASLSNAIEAKSRGAYIIGVSDRESEVYDFWVRIPTVDELLYPIVTVVPLQLLAYHVAVARGCDPDKPRNLAKSVTVR